MPSFATLLAYAAFAGAIVSWIAGAVLCVRAGSPWLAPVWPLAIGRIRRAGGEPAVQINKALVAFIACMLIGVAAFSASTNLHRFAK